MRRQGGVYGRTRDGQDSLRSPSRGRLGRAREETRRHLHRVALDDETTGAAVLESGKGNQVELAVGEDGHALRSQELPRRRAEKAVEQPGQAVARESSRPDL